MNTHTIKCQVQKGFTLVELLIVVIILAILAAIVVPQFASSTDDAKLASLDSTLSNVRSAIDLYRQQHDSYPGQKTAVPDATCTSTVKGTGVADSNAAFLSQMSMYTNAAGEACGIADNNADGTPEYPYGPYMKKSSLPSNPISEVATLQIIATGDLSMVGTGPAGGWKYDTKTGKFIANDTNNGYDLR